MRWSTMLGTGVLAILLQSCTGGGASYNEGSAFVVTGRITDQGGSGIAGVMVTVDGVEADTLSEGDGTFVVYSDFEPVGGTVKVTALVAGKQSTVADLPVSRSGRVVDVEDPLEMPDDANPDQLVITGPLDGQIVKPDESCGLGVTVTGYAHRQVLVANNDIVILIDRSGSTGEPSGFAGRSVFEQEIMAAKQLVKRLERDTYRIAIVGFATDAELVLSPTTNRKEVLEVLEELEDILDEGPELVGQAGAASDFQEALQRAAQVFVDTPWTIEDPDVAASTVAVTAHKRLLFFTDGVPTLPVAPGLTQERGDIEATLAAAEDLAASGIVVHGFAIGPAIETNKLTTLPAVAAITSGSYRAINSQGDIEVEMDLVTWLPVESVTWENLSNDDDPVSVTPGPDGFFSVEVPINLGSQEIRISTPGGVFEDITVVGEFADSNDTPFALFDDTVSELGFLRPDGSLLLAEDQSLFDGELGDTATQTSSGVFVAHSSLGAGDVTINAAFVYKEAAWLCDVGYLVLDTSLPDPTASIEERFEAATAANVLFNTGSFSNTTLMAPGAADYSFQIPAATPVVFFIVANGTLAQAGSKPVHFTVPRFNGGGHTQHIAFYAPDGRRDAGDQVGVLLGFEDMPLTGGSDKDFSDCLLYLTGLLPTDSDCGEAD
jgi:Mg-chelatase subunit ChlD